MSRSPPLQQRFQAWLADSADEVVLRWIFRSAVVVTVTVLALDVAGMQGWTGSPEPAAAPAETSSPALNLPSLLPSILAPLLPGGDKRVMPLPQPDGVLARPMTFDLLSGGKLMATGT